MMTRFRLASVSLILVALGACAESTAPGPMLDAGAAQFSGTLHSDPTATSITSQTGDLNARDGGNMMGGGGR